MKKLTKKLGMFMLVLVLALCPLLTFTGCVDKDDVNETSSVTLTLDQAEAVLKSMIVEFDSTNSADTSKYVNIPSYEETVKSSSGEGATINPDADVDSARIRINNNAGELRALYVEEAKDGEAEEAQFIYHGKYYSYLKTPNHSTGTTTEQTASEYYNDVIGYCDYIADQSESIWAELGLVAGTTVVGTLTKSYSYESNVYTITYSIINSEEDVQGETPSDGSNRLTWDKNEVTTISITFDATARRLVKITESYIITKTYTSAGTTWDHKTVAVGDVEGEWDYLTCEYKYNLIDAFTIPQTYIDAIGE